MKNLPREPMPGRDRVAVCVPAAHPHPVYLFGQRSIEDPEHGQIKRAPAHDVVVWDSYYQYLYSTGALELVGIVLGTPCARCKEMPFSAEQAADEAGLQDGRRAHHPACPELQPAAPPAEEPAAPPAPTPTPTEEGQ